MSRKRIVLLSVALSLSGAATLAPFGTAAGEAAAGETAAGATAAGAIPAGATAAGTPAGATAARKGQLPGGALSRSNTTRSPTSNFVVGAQWTSPRFDPPANQSGDILPTVW